ncbi:MAG: hypothetical protein BWK76_19665 [Desulfobulbaceae bacterium A2]|nr:MAG: hypothetical protein BWK76_19665 [Desulfobulbaceae bacterium A2]
MRSFASGLFTLLLIGGLFCQAAPAEETIPRWWQQTLLIPVYSDIYGGDRYRDKPILLTSTLVLRNCDPLHPISVDLVDYLDNGGKLIRQYLQQPQVLGPLASTHFIVRESDTAGGAGAKFIVRWHADKAVVEPIVESVMIGTIMQQGISFSSRGRILAGERPSTDQASSK